MATGVRFEKFSENIARGVHNLASNALKVYFSNAAPDAAAHTVKGDIAEIAGGNGYTATGHSITPGISRTGAVTSLTGVDVTVTASGGALPTFRYIVLYDDTPTSPADPLIQYWDYGSAITPASGESFVVDFGSSVLTIG